MLCPRVSQHGGAVRNHDLCARALTRFGLSMSSALPALRTHHPLSQPSFACAICFPSLAKALDFTGIIGIMLPFVVTPLLHRASLKACHEHWGERVFDEAERAGGFASVASHPVMVVLFGIFGASLLIFCVACGIMYGF